MSDLFISYSRRDQAFVRELHTALEKEGKDVWVDWENIPLTAEWLQEIYDGIEAGDAFAYVITPDSVRSEVCSLELAHAISHNKRLIPILRRELVEDMDKKALDPKISSHNWIYYRDTDDFDKAYHSLKDALNTDLDYLKTHTRLLIKAVEWNDKERDTGLVLRGNDLNLASKWLQESADKEPIPTDLQREYIIASQRAATARFRAFALYAVYGVVVILLAGFALLQASNAEQRRQEAVEQRQVAEANEAEANAAKATAIYNGDQARSLALASNAQQILYRDRDPELALALSLVANTTVEQPPILAQGALAQAAYFPGTRYILSNGTKEISRVAAEQSHNTLLFVDTTNALTLIDADTKETLQTWPAAAPDDVIRAVAFTPDGLYAAAGYGSGRIQIYNTEDAALFQDIPGSEESGTVWDMEFSPDGKYLVGAYGDGQARVWEWRNGTLSLTFAGHVEENALRKASPPAIWGLTIRPDSRAVLTVDDQLGLLMVWDIETGERLTLFDGEAGPARAVDFLPDGQSALVGYDDAVVRWIDLETLTIRRDFIGHTLLLWDVAVTPNGEEALSASFDNNVIHWNLTTGEILEEFKGHGSDVYGIATLGSRFVSASNDGTLRYWDLASGAQISQYFAASSITDIYAIGSGEETAIMIGTGSGPIEVLDPLLVPQRSFASDGILAVDVYPSQDLLVTASASEGLVTVWQFSDGVSLKEKLFDHRIYSLDIHPDGEWIALVGASPDYILWNWKTDEMRQIPTATKEEIGLQDAQIRAVQFTLDGTQILVAGIGSVSNDVLMFDMASDTLARRYSGHSGLVYSIDVSLNGRYIAAASEDNSIIVWRTDDSEALRSFYGHTSDVVGVRFSNDSRLLVSGGYDNTVRLWDVNTTNELQRFDTKSPIVAVAFDSTGSAIFTGDAAGNLQHWQIRDLPALLEWINANRYIPELSCEQKVLYQISEATCGLEG